MRSAMSVVSFGAAFVSTLFLLSFVAGNSMPPIPAPHPRITLKPNPPKAGEDVEIGVEWDVMPVDSTELEVSFQGGNGTPITIKLKKPNKAVIGLPKGATRIIVTDPSHYLTEVRAEISN